MEMLDLSCVRCRTASRAAGLAPLDSCRCPVRPDAFCGGLGVDGLAALEAIGHHATFRPRAGLFMEGVPAATVYNVTGGVVRLYRLSPGGRRLVVGFALPGDFLGLPFDETYPFSAEAVVASTACRFPRDAFLAVADRHWPLAHRLHRAASRALDLAHDQMMLLGPRPAEAKLAAFVLAMRRRWARRHGISALVPLPMGRQDIADYLGLTIATVSRTLHRLERARLIDIVPKAARIRDLHRLEALAAG